jgi:hypothetical protein
MGSSCHDTDQMVERELQQEVAEEVEQYSALGPAPLSCWSSVSLYDERAWLSEVVLLFKSSRTRSSRSTSTEQPIHCEKLPRGKLFSKGIWFTENLLISTTSQPRDVQTPHQKPVYFVLAVQDTDKAGNTTIRAVFCAHTDARFFDTRIKEIPGAGTRRKLTLCDADGQTLRAGARPVDASVLDGDIFQSYLAQAKAMSWLYTHELKLSQRQLPRLQEWLQDGTQEEREQKRTMVGGSEMLSDKRAKKLNTIEDTPLMKRTGVESFETLSGKEAKRLKTTEDGAAHDFEAIAVKEYGTSGQDTANNMVTAVKIYNAAQGAQLRLSWSQEEKQFVLHESSGLSADNLIEIFSTQNYEAYGPMSRKEKTPDGDWIISLTWDF